MHAFQQKKKQKKRSRLDAMDLSSRGPNMFKLWLDWRWCLRVFRQWTMIVIGASNHDLFDDILAVALLSSLNGKENAIERIIGDEKNFFSTFQLFYSNTDLFVVGQQCWSHHQYYFHMVWPCWLNGCFAGNVSLRLQVCKKKFKVHILFSKIPWRQIVRLIAIRCHRFDGVRDKQMSMSVKNIRK